MLWIVGICAELRILMVLLSLRLYARKALAPSSPLSHCVLASSGKLVVRAIPMACATSGCTLGFHGCPFIRLLTLGMLLRSHVVSGGVIGKLREQIFEPGSLSARKFVMRGDPNNSSKSCVVEIRLHMVPSFVKCDRPSDRPAVRPVHG